MTSENPPKRYEGHVENKRELPVAGNNRSLECRRESPDTVDGR